MMNLWIWDSGFAYGYAARPDLKNGRGLTYQCFIPT